MQFLPESFARKMDFTDFNPNSVFFTQKVFFIHFAPKIHISPNVRL